MQQHCNTVLLIITGALYGCTATHTHTHTHDTHKHTISSGRQSARRLQVSAAFPPVSCTLARAVDRATPSHKPRLAPSNGLSHQGSSPDQSLSCHDVLYRDTSTLQAWYVPAQCTRSLAACEMQREPLAPRGLDSTYSTVQYSILAPNILSPSLRRRRPTRTVDARGAMTSTSEITKYESCPLRLGDRPLLLLHPALWYQHVVPRQSTRATSTRACTVTVAAAVGGWSRWTIGNARLGGGRREAASGQGCIAGVMSHHLHGTASHRIASHHARELSAQTCSYPSRCGRTPSSAWPAGGAAHLARTVMSNEGGGLGNGTLIPQACSM